MANDWTTTYCTQEEGFPKVLYAVAVWLGIPDRLEYVGREYVEEGTEYCKITVHIGVSDKFLDMKPWCVTATGSRLTDTYQLVACKALKYLSKMYEWHLGPTSMKYFSPLDRNRPAWEARVRTLKSLAFQEDDPTVIAMSGYLLTLDQLGDLQHDQVSHLVLRPKLDAHHMYAQNQVVIYTVRMWIQKTNVFIISYLITSLERTKQRNGPHFATCSWPGVSHV
jgi:hypothetical protein